MGLNQRCPKCGSTMVQLSSDRRGMGCLWFVLFGIWYVLWVIFKWIIGIYVFLLYDWWMAIIHAAMGKKHIWVCKKLFIARRRTYYCHTCGHNFKV